MAILGAEDYLCEICKHFNTDGIDGNHPYCMKQGILESKAVRLNDVCLYGWELGVPMGYPSSFEYNSKRAKRLLKKIGSSDIWYARKPLCTIETGYGENGEYKYCSRCGCPLKTEGVLFYCYNCGARVMNHE